MRSFAGNRLLYSGQRFSNVARQMPRSMEFRSHSVSSNAGAIHAYQFAQGNNYRVDRLSRFSNGGNHTLANVRSERNRQLRNGQFRNGNATLRSDWRKHVFAQHSASWAKGWDRGHDHWWHGHRCHFVSGSWFVFDVGFDPWWPWWYYPYRYYGYGYAYPYSYDYDPGYFDSDAYYDNGGYADQSGSSTIAAVQERLAREGYYRRQIDGVFGSETRAAIADYQSNHSLRVTGVLTNETLAALGLRSVASY